MSRATSEEFEPIADAYTTSFIDSRTQEECDLSLAALYRQTRYRTGDEIPKLERYLALQPFDPEPARQLLERYADISYPYSCRFGLAELEIDEGVFCPTFTSASPFLLRNTPFRPGQKTLDAFAGSGAFGINAALRGGEAVTFDISPEAVACAKKNAALNGVADKVDVRQGTLLECISDGETFDLITANPPLIPGDPEAQLETALFDPGLQATEEFIAALPNLLTKRGRCYLLTSDVIDRRGYKFDIATACKEAGLRMEIIAQMHKPYESYRVHRIEQRAPSLRHMLRTAGRIGRAVLEYEIF